jgi:hypothetical protein
MMKRLFFNILLTAIILAAAHITGTAQNDSPLYQNIISDDISSPIDTASQRPQNGTIVPQNNPKATQDTLRPATSDNDLGEQMQNLQRLYLAGKYDEDLQLSQTIRENHPQINNDDEIDRQKYTIASLKEMEYNEQADSAAKQFYGRNPFYKPKSSDPVPFKEILSNYYATPRFSVWASIGQSLAVPVLDTVHVITDTTQMKPEYDFIQSEIVQLGFEYHPWKCISVSVAPTYTKYRYTRTIDRNMRSTFHYEETDKLISVPLRIEAYWARKDRPKWAPSIYLGASAKYIIKSTYTAYLETPGERRYETSAKTLDADDKNRLNFAILGGARLSYNFNRITIFGDLGMSMDIKPFNNPEAAYSNNDLAYDKMYIPDIFHMLELSAMIGVKVNMKYKTIAKFGYGH